MYSSSNLVISGMDGPFKCRECKMTFNGQHLLQKHKAKFCVGSGADPDDLQLKRGFRSTSPHRYNSPDDRFKGSKPVSREVDSPHATNTHSNKPHDTRDRLANAELGDWKEEAIEPGASSEQIREGVYTASSDGDLLPHTPREEVVLDKPYTDSELISKKIGQLKQIKDRRTRSRDINDLEERILLDKMAAMESPRQARGNKTVPLSKHRDIRDLQVEYERLRDLESTVAKQPVRMGTSRAGRLSPYSRDSNSSMSIHIVDDDLNRRPNQDQLRSLAQQHGETMEYYRLRNKDLEKKREDIMKQLEGLGRRPVAAPPDHTQDLLRELRMQEERNQRALDDLKRQLYDMNNQNNKVNVMDLEMACQRTGKIIQVIDDLQEKIQQKEVEVNEAVKKYNIPNPFDKSDKGVVSKASSSKQVVKEKSRNALVGVTEAVSKENPNLNKDVSDTSSLNTEKNTEIKSEADNCVPEVTTSKKDVTVHSILATNQKCFTDDIDTPNKNDDSNDYLEPLLSAMRAKQSELDMLKRKGYSKSNLQAYSSEVPVERSQPPPPPPPEPPRKQLVFPVYYGKSLVAEISAIRQAYLQNNGNDPDVLAQMAQMQAEAQAIEDQQNQKPDKKSPREKPKDNSDMIRFMETENERLNSELRMLQEQKLLAANRGRSDKEDELEREIRRLQHEHLSKMGGLQREMDDLKMMLLMERNKPAPAPTTVVHQPPQPQVNVKPYVEVEALAQYDQYAGFVIFYDFIHNMDPTVQACRMVVGLHSSSAVMGEPSVLPTVYAEPASRDGHSYNYSNCVIGAKQPVPRCPPEADLGIVSELQLSGGPGSEHDRHSLITRAWAKIPLFDNNGKLIAGRFKIPMRNVPIKPFLHVSQVQRLQKYGDCELYYRIVNMRDAEIHSMQQVSAANYNQYNQPMLPTEEIPVYTPKLNIPPPPTDTPRRKQNSAPRSQPAEAPRLPSIQRGRGSVSPPQVMSLQDQVLGFQVDRVKNAEPGEGKVRVTAYQASTGKIVQSSTSPVTCSTTAVRSNFKYGYHVFGQQEATFREVDYAGDMVLIARFYLKKRNSDGMDDFNMPEQGAQEPSLYDDETLVAWSAIPLVIVDDTVPMKKRRVYNPNTMAINQGTHTLQLYHPPVPEPHQVPQGDQGFGRDYERYGKASLRVYVFQGTPRPGSLTPSDMSETEDEDTLPEFAWLPLERKTPPKDPYLLGDGFDIYIDGCRYLPDSVTFTKVAGRILDRRYDVAGKDINTGVKLDSDVYNPVYEEKTEFRETNIPPTATLLCKVYTIDNFYKTLTVVGYACMNIFVETGTERQPTVDKPMQVSLNEGSHQLRMYSQGPNGVDPFTENCLRDSGVRIIPCATILVRLVKVSRGAGGKALESSKVPQADWLRMGLYQPRPKYTDRVYYSSKCMPTKGETRLFHSMMKRTRRTIREVIALVASAKESFLRSDKNMEEYIRNQLTKAPDAKPLDQDLNFICKYSARNGIKIAVDSAVNLPWSNFTHVHMCLNPPAAFYLGAPHATYDKLTFTELLDVRSTNTSPAWKDGFKHFPRRSYHRFLTMIIHLQEIQVTVAKDNYKYGLLEQAWTAVQVFTDKYCNTQAYQLPLFAGSPSQTILKQLAREPCKEWMERMIRNNGIHLLEGSSIFVRVSDSRREDELQSDISHNKLVEVNTDYIPVGLEESYSRERPGKPLESIVPIGKTPEQFVDNLKTKFKSLVYKLYEEGNVGK